MLECKNPTLNDRPVDNTNLISENYKLLNEKLHDEHQEFGNRNNFLARELPVSIAILHKLFGYKSVLDYGCGKGLILDALEEKLNKLGVNCQGYDPCIKEFAGAPIPADILLCTDVLEHVEPEKTEEVLNHIHSLTINVSYIIIDLLPAAKSLSDGRNAHINLQATGWWLSALSSRFPFSLQCINESPGNPKKNKPPTKKLIFVGARKKQGIIPAINLFTATHANASQGSFQNISNINANS